MRIAIAFLALLLSVSTLIAQQTSALINEALDKQVKLELKTTLPQGIETIEQQTGVRIVVQPRVWELLPWGDQTSFTAKIENQTLRQALQAITRKLGLTFQLKDEFVEIQPMPALSRLGRRSTVQEIQALDLLSSTPFKGEPALMEVGSLLSAIDQQLVEAKAPFVVEIRAGENITRVEGLRVPRNSTLFDALESIHTQTAGTWYPWGESIVVVAKPDQIRNQLNKTITTRFDGVEISQVLLELSQLAGVEFSIEPGAIQRVAADARNIRLILDNATIRQALENIAGFTGLAYVINDTGVYLWNQSATPVAGATTSRDRAIGWIQLDNGVNLLLPGSQVPPDVKAYLEYRREKYFQSIREMMKEENFTPPATQSSTQPEDL